MPMESELKMENTPEAPMSYPSLVGIALSYYQKGNHEIQDFILHIKSDAASFLAGKESSPLLQNGIDAIRAEAAKLQLMDLDLSDLAIAKGILQTE